MVTVITHLAAGAQGAACARTILVQDLMHTSPKSAAKPTSSKFCGDMAVSASSA